MKIIAGIGSRKPPENILKEMEDLGAFCRRQGIKVRSGHAEGADYAFERGAKDHSLVYLPYPAFNKRSRLLSNAVVSLPPRHGQNPYDSPHPKALERAHEAVRKFHPAKSLSDSAKAFHLRNYFQVMGHEIEEQPVVAVVFWALVENGEVQGGTGQAVRIAKAHGIPVFNLDDLPPSEVEDFLTNL